MKKCSSPDHPHCTLWVMPGETACAGGHAQRPPAPSSFDLISAMRRDRPAIVAAAVPVFGRPYLHVSGFDPRAAGGRQAIKVELRDMPPEREGVLTMQLQSALITHGAARHSVVRGLHGGWRPFYIEFSSRGHEHGQYQVEVELSRTLDGATCQKWVCTLVLLVPRPDASLTDIHQTFLATHKNVRVMADDASIARIKAPGGGRLDLDVNARNASIAQVDLHADAGQAEMGFATIGWDEDLIEIDVPARGLEHPHASQAACLVNAAPDAMAQRQVRLFALRECVLGRFEQYDPEADVLLTHFGDDGQDRNGLTRRLSGRHAIIRRGPAGFEIEDVSRYGILLDGTWPGKNRPVALRLGMRIDFSASIKGIVVMHVTALMPHGVILHRVDQGRNAECYYLLEPERHPGYPLPAFPAAPRANVMPLLFHLHGGFWHLDPVTGCETPLGPGTPLERLAQVPRHNRFAQDPYPEAFIERNCGALVLATA